jgi:hypothetical protein
LTAAIQRALADRFGDYFLAVGPAFDGSSRSLVIAALDMER